MAHHLWCESNDPAPARIIGVEPVSLGNHWHFVWYRATFALLDARQVAGRQSAGGGYVRDGLPG
jgi:hypothetical protein